MSVIRAIPINIGIPIFVNEFLDSTCECFVFSYFFEENLKYEDTPFVAKALDSAKKIGKIDKCLNHYLIHDNSETTIRDRRCFDIFKRFFYLVYCHNSILFDTANIQ